MKVLPIFAFFVIASLLITGCVSFSKVTPFKTTQSDYGQDLQDKIVMRVLANPIKDASTFNLIVRSVITDNPFACVGYIADGETHDPVEKTNEAYTAQIFYKDNYGNTISATEIIYNSSAEYKSGVATAHDQKFDTYSATLKCHDTNGENYYVVFTRDYVMLSGYSDDSIQTGFETWANTVASLTPVKERPKQKGYLGSIADVGIVFW